MMEIIYNIPEVIGWIAVGVLATLCTLAIIKLVKIGMEIYRDYKEEEVKLCMKKKF